MKGNNEEAMKCLNDSIQLIEEGGGNKNVAKQVIILLIIL